MIRRGVSLLVALAVLSLVAVVGDDPIGAGAAVSGSGYWMLAADGSVSSFGSGANLGNGPTGSVDIEPTPAGDGYWILGERGTVTARGTARVFGGSPALRPGEQAASLSVTPSGAGYWIFTSAGRVFPLGDATFLGDMAATRLNQPVLDSVATSTGKGYWMVAGDGGIFSFGDARFFGSMGSTRLNKPVMSMAADPDGVGYWLVASDGGIFAFDAGFYGSMGSTPLNKPVSGMVPGGAGYLMVAEDGGIFAFGDVAFHGSLGAHPPASPIVAVALLPAGPSPATTTTTTTTPPAAGTPAPIVIGHVGTYSGASARPAGDGTWADAADAVSAWVGAVNAAGGIAGRPVSLIIGDDGGDPARHLDLLESMDRQGVAAFVGNWSGAADATARAWLNDRAIPVIGGDLLSGAWDTDPILFAQGSGVHARVDGLNATAVARGAHKVAVIRCAETADCASLADYETATAAPKAGLAVVFSATVSRVQPDYKTVCNQARTAGADTIFYPGGPGTPTWVRLQADCYSVGYHPLLIVPTADIPQDTPTPGILAALPTLPWLSHNPAMTAADTALHQTFPGLTTSPQSAQTWAAAKLFERALAAAPSVDRAGVLAGLRTLKNETVDGLTPPLTFVPGERTPANCYFLVDSKAAGWTAPATDAPSCPS